MNINNDIYENESELELVLNHPDKQAEPEVLLMDDDEKEKLGKIVGFTGPMFSRKTTRLLMEYEYYILANKKSLVIKPIIDTRYGLEHVATHLGFKVDAFPVKNSEELSELVEEYNYRALIVKYNSHVYQFTGKVEAIFVDEVQFFDSGVIDVFESLANSGLDVFWSGLNQDYRGRPFVFSDEKEHIGYLMAISDEIYVLKAVCSVCHREATKTYKKLVNGDKVIDVGGSEKYEPRCRRHHSY